MSERVQGLHTGGPWRESFFSKADGSPILTVADVADTVAASVQHSERADLWGVTLDDADQNPDGRATVVCYTGNGPNAHNNARAISAVPVMTQFLRRLLFERDHGFVYSADRRIAEQMLAFLEGRREEAQKPSPEQEPQPSTPTQVSVSHCRKCGAFLNHGHECATPTQVCTCRHDSGGSSACSRCTPTQEGDQR